MKKLLEQLYNTTEDMNLRNELAQILTVVYCYDELPDEVAEEVRERMEYILQGKKHYKRVDK